MFLMMHHFFVFIYTHNTLNYSYSLWKEEKGGKEIFVLGNREKTDSVLENGNVSRTLDGRSNLNNKSVSFKSM